MSVLVDWMHGRASPTTTLHWDSIQVHRASVCSSSVNSAVRLQSIQSRARWYVFVFRLLPPLSTMHACPSWLPCWASWGLLSTERRSWPTLTLVVWSPVHPIQQKSRPFRPCHLCIPIPSAFLLLLLSSRTLSVSFPTNNHPTTRPMHLDQHFPTPRFAYTKNTH